MGARTQLRQEKRRRARHVVGGHALAVRAVSAFVHHDDAPQPFSPLCRPAASIHCRTQRLQLAGLGPPIATAVNHKCRHTQLGQPSAVAGPDLATDAFTRTSVHRNLYRMPLP